jgi:hypothetical protein
VMNHCIESAWEVGPYKVKIIYVVFVSVVLCCVALCCLFVVFCRVVCCVAFCVCVSICLMLEFRQYLYICCLQSTPIMIGEVHWF